MTPLIISADDYALRAGVDDGILALITQGRLTAASCLTLSPRWAQAARRLDAEIRARADIGLHLDFTQYGQMRQPLPVLIARSLCRQLSAEAIRDNIHRQLDAFEAHAGSAPDYIDGHQHVHQLPQIRDQLLTIISQRYAGRLPWLRISRPPASDGLKAMVLSSLGASPLGRQAQQLNLAYSSLLLGVYGFQGGAEHYRRRLQAWLGLAQSTAGSVLMCHPAMPGGPAVEAAHDPIHAARLNEYEVLAGSGFEQLLAATGIQPARGSIVL